MKFDVSDVIVAAPAPRRRTITSIPLDDDDMLELACELPPRLRTAAGTQPPSPREADDVEIAIDAIPEPIDPS